MAQKPEDGDLTGVQVLNALESLSGEITKIKHDHRLRSDILEIDAGKASDYLKIRDGAPGMTRAELIARLRNLSQSFPKLFEKPIMARVPLATGITTSPSWYFYRACC